MDTFHHPSLGAFEWQEEVDSWVQRVEVPMGERTEEVHMHLHGYKQEHVTDAQVDLAQRLVSGILARRWSEVQAKALQPPTEFQTVWDFEARRAHTSIVVFDDRKWSVEVFIEGPDGEAPDLFNDLPMCFDFVDPPADASSTTP